MDNYNDTKEKNQSGTRSTDQGMGKTGQSGSSSTQPKQGQSNPSSTTPGKSQTSPVERESDDQGKSSSSRNS
ncbi:MAG: hypothetical protein Q8916_13780 [Bacteroidota bacterium]|nr:hypothetical protein [Bacteroidota bacterium]MDP4234994.1 hypothetical protein [Bacteroidota bacterium]